MIRLKIEQLRLFESWRRLVWRSGAVNERAGARHGWPWVPDGIQIWCPKADRTGATVPLAGGSWAPAGKR
jgi:hypothetical protein